MGIFSGGSGDDRMQVGMAVFAVIVSLIVTMMVPIVAPAYDTDTGYSYADLFAEKSGLENFTGESMINMAPWKLTGVYTPWTVGDPIDNLNDEGWAYGQEITNYPYLGQTSGIKLDPNQYSDKPLYQSTYKNMQRTVTEPISWYYNFNGDGNLNVIGQIAEFFGADTTETRTEVLDINSWTYSGYRYEFDPMLKIDYQNDTHDYQEIAQSDAKLSIVWYKQINGIQGLSGGLILYDNMTNGVVANITMDDILATYNSGSNYSTRYQFDFQGVQVYLNLRFDLDVTTGGQDLTKAFNDGRWSMAITAASMDNFMDISASNSLSNSTANLLDTYIKIYTFSFPTLDFLWSMVLWIICILPIQLTVLMFLSRFGIAGVGLGIAGSAILALMGSG